VRNRLRRALLLIRGNRGSASIETAVSAAVLLAMLFGIAQMSIALYSYHYVSDVTRQATRYAMVRGSKSCTNTPNLSGCNASADQITAYVKSLKFPGIRMTDANPTVTTLWCQASTWGPGTSTTTWSACSAGTSNAPGNEVFVTVSYKMTFHIPFSNDYTGAKFLTTSSSSKMVISQ
jgi:Flp pilus assembly protein TadG